MKSELFFRTQTQGTPLEWLPDAAGIENEVITIYPDQTRETWDGFGAALTGASGSVYARMTQAQRQQMMETYFSPRQMGYNRVRIHLDSCDFCPEMYEADSDAQDCLLEKFDFSRTEALILPMLRDAEAAAGQKLRLMLSPWSPPAYMKSNGQRCQGGSLKPEYYDRWAEYLCRYIAEFQKRGFFVERISLQNEPKAVQTWDSCVYTAQQEKLFLQVMHRALLRHGMQDVQVFVWDHNKERAFERAAGILDQVTRPMVAGVACHWYSGDHFENLDLVRQAYPELKLIISESCIEYNKFDKSADTANAVRLTHEILGDLNHGVSAFYDWNLLLDQDGGPNHVGNFCHAPFLFDTRTGTLHPQLLLDYFSLCARAIRPGSVRLVCSRYTDACDAAACRRPDGRLAVVLLNRTDRPLPVHLRLNGQVAELVLPAYEPAVCLM